MSEMVEKVAAKLREIAPNMPFAVAGGDAHELLARVAIEAMRATPRMKLAVAEVFAQVAKSVDPDGGHRAPDFLAEAEQAIEAMIDEALK